IPQVELTVVCRVLAGHVGPLRQLLGPMGRHPAHNAVIPFGRLAGVHSARLLLLDETAGPGGESFPAWLILMADLDAPLDVRLAQLVDVAGAGLDSLFTHCERYPHCDGIGPDERLSFLCEHIVHSSAYYTNTVGRTVQQIHDEERLREAVEGFLDTRTDW